MATFLGIAFQILKCNPLLKRKKRSFWEIFKPKKKKILNLGSINQTYSVWKNIDFYHVIIRKWLNFSVNCAECIRYFDLTLVKAAKLLFMLHLHELQFLMWLSNSLNWQNPNTKSLLHILLYTFVKLCNLYFTTHFVTRNKIHFHFLEKHNKKWKNIFSSLWILLNPLCIAEYL